MHMVKNIVALVISILAFFTLLVCMWGAADSIGLPSYIDLDQSGAISHGSGRASYEQDVDSITTDVGYYTMIVSFMFAFRVYVSIITWKINGDFSRADNVTWLYWLAGLTVYILVTMPIWHIEMPIMIQRALSLACGFGIYRFFSVRHRIAINKVNDENLHESS